MSATLHLRRLPLLGLAIFALLLGLWSGLLRLGWTWSGMATHLPAIHGGLMVGGFLGTLISLERAVAVERRWAYLAPIFCGLGGLALIAGAPVWLGALLIALGSGVTFAIFVLILRMQTALFTVVMALGVVLWTVGNLLWLGGWPIPRLVLWWAAFTIFTISGERLELSRLLRLTPSVQALFVAAASLLLAGLFVSLGDHAAGSRIAGAGMVGVALWLLRFDIAQRRIKAGGLARFIALALIAGYLWLGIGGVLALVHGGLWAGPYYDALLHALFLGFVFSMIFGHAPIIFPAVLGLPIAYSGRFYLPLVLLHGTLALRVAGDLLLWIPGRQWGGLLNVVVLLLFLATMLLSLGRRTTADQRPQTTSVVAPLRRPLCRADVDSQPEFSMPILTRTFLKAALVSFVAALVAGVLVMARPLLELPRFVIGLAPVYFHLLMVGWVTQLIIGMAYWMFPRYTREQPRGREWLAWTTFALLNIGLVLRVIGEPVLAVGAAEAWGWVLAASALLQWTAAMAFVISIWPRVKGR